jgi:hypothetical protein
MGSYESNVEFLGFLAHLADPGTGEILLARLSCWLGLSEAELEDRWTASGRGEWRHFADDILQVLDRMQDITESLAATLVWYRHQAIGEGSDRSADELVASGNTSVALALIRPVGSRCDSALRVARDGRDLRNRHEHQHRPKSGAS